MAIFMLAGSTMAASCYCCLSTRCYTTQATIYELPSTINPNQSSIADLLCLPGIGPIRARAIINYREQQSSPAFLDADDLEHVKGIGSGIVNQMRPWLSFDAY